MFYFGDREYRVYLRMALVAPFLDLLECGQNPVGQAAEFKFLKKGNPSSRSFCKSSECCILAV